jgi:hypothetical protein
LLKTFNQNFPHQNFQASKTPNIAINGRREDFFENMDFAPWKTLIFACVGSKFVENPDNFGQLARNRKFPNHCFLALSRHCWDFPSYSLICPTNGVKGPLPCTHGSVAKSVTSRRNGCFLGLSLTVSVTVGLTVFVAVLERLF